MTVIVRFVLFFFIFFVLLILLDLFLVGLARRRLLGVGNLTKVRQLGLVGGNSPIIDKLLELALEGIAQRDGPAEDGRRRAIVDLGVMENLGNILDKLGVAVVQLFGDFMLRTTC